MDTFIQTTPFFSSEHRALAGRLAQFSEREIEARAGDDERETDEALRGYVLLLAENDLLKHAVARPGQPFDLRSFCIIRETLSYSSSLADLAFVMQGLGTYAISLAATEHVRDFWLARAAIGKAIAAFALTEPEAGSDVAALKTTARREDDSYIIDGRKRFISNAGVADFYTVFARTGTREDGRAEISAFIVSARMPGFSVAERTEMIAPHPIGELEFKSCKVPAEDMIGKPGDGLRLSLQTLDMFRASVGAAACGMARRALDESLLYARSRQQFGKPLAGHQLIQEKLADMATELDAARLLVIAPLTRRTLASGPRPGKPARRNSSQLKPPAGSSIKRCRFTAARVWYGALWSNACTVMRALCASMKALPKSKSSSLPINS